MSDLNETEKGEEIRVIRRTSLKLIIASCTLAGTFLLVLMIHALVEAEPRKTLTVLSVNRTYSQNEQDGRDGKNNVAMKAHQLKEPSAARKLNIEAAAAKNTSVKADSLETTPTPATKRCSNYPGTILSPQGKCVKVFESYCNSTKACVSGLYCHMDVNKCSCRYKDQVYLPETLSCVSKATGPCGKDFSCVNNAECKTFLNSSNGLCVCKEGSVMNDKRGCDPGHLQQCSTGSECASGFHCINGVCHCPDFGTYFPEKKSCLRLVGSVCKKFYGESDCVENARCKSKNGYPVRHYAYSSAEGICACSDGYEVAPDYTCKQREMASMTLLTEI